MYFASSAAIIVYSVLLLLIVVVVVNIFSRLGFVGCVGNYSSSEKSVGLGRSSWLEI